MSIFNRLFGRKNAEIIDTSEKLAALLGSWYSSDAGEEITSANALQITTVYSCIRVIAESIGMLPSSMMVETQKGKEKALEHPVHRLFNVAPNEYMTAQEYKELITAHLMLKGNHYSYINRINGRPAELLPMAPDAVSVKLLNDYTVEYTVTFKNGTTQVVPSGDILHIKLMTVDGVTGLSPISQARNALGLAKATERHGSRLFKNGANPFGVLKAQGNLTDEQFNGLKGQIESYSGDGAFKPLILEGGLEWTQVAISPEDSQFLETRKYQRSEIAGLFRVPPHMIGDLERATFSNIEHQSLQFVREALMPHITRIENRVRLSLIPENEQSRYFLKFNVNALLRGDMKTRAEFYTKLQQAGALSPNEIREKEDMNPREGGDIYLTPLNMAINGKPIEESENADQE
uniref:phage portal protein n=1 Tax=Ningiella ruwaisensis TaxID=2364274 RepID=UPI0010A05749|nr:phage portal protein [Ningiella ruwaisensis]